MKSRVCLEEGPTCRDKSPTLVRRVQKVDCQVASAPVPNSIIRKPNQKIPNPIHNPKSRTQTLHGPLTKGIMKNEAKRLDSEFCIADGLWTGRKGPTRHFGDGVSGPGLASRAPSQCANTLCIKKVRHSSISHAKRMCAGKLV